MRQTDKRLAFERDFKKETPAPNDHDKKSFTVRHDWTVSKDYEVEAATKEEAVDIIRDKVDAGGVCIWTDGYEATDDDHVYIPEDVGRD